MIEQHGDLVVDPWVGIAVAVVLVVVLLVIVIFGRRGASEADTIVERLKTAESELAKVQHDLSNVRHIVNNQPTNLDLQTVGSRMTNIETVLNANTHSLTRIEDFLFQAAGQALIVGRPRGGDT